MISSKNLYEFYKAWLDWSTNDGQRGELFSPRMGLCGNLDSWMYKKGYYHQAPDVEMKAQFLEAGLCTRLPFQDASAYRQEVVEETLHKNDTRLMWVRGRIMEYEHIQKRGEK